MVGPENELAAAAPAWLWIRGHRRVAAVVITAPALASGVFVALKEFVRRTRPTGALRLHLVTYAFPSGHATTSAALYERFRARIARGADAAPTATPITGHPT